MISTSEYRRAVRGSEQSIDFLVTQEGDDRSLEALRRDREHTFDEGCMFGVAQGGETEQRMDGGEPCVAAPALLFRSVSKWSRNDPTSGASMSSRRSADGAVPVFPSAKARRSRNVSR